MDRRERSFWSASNGWALLVLASVAVTVAGCITSTGQSSKAPPSPDTIDQIREIDLSARYPQNTRFTEKAASVEGPQPASYYGDGSSAAAGVRPNLGGRGVETEPDNDPVTTGALPARTERGAGDKGYEINFENTPIQTAAKTILGDILGVGYTIDPRVQGNLSLSSGRPVPKKDILYVLESALRVANVALVREQRGYRLVTAPEAAGTGAIDSGQGLEPGYGITVIPVQYVSAQTLTKLLDNFGTKQGMVRADPSRNLVVIQGSAADRRTAIDVMQTFDADWMRGQSVGVYPVSNSAPEPIIAELERIVDSGEGGLGQNVIKLQPIGRQNAVLVVTRRPELLKTVAAWITRLDKSGSAGTGVKVYRMRYGDARQIAALLNDVFLGNSGNGLDPSTNQLIPGGGAVASSSDRLGLGPSSQNSGSPPMGAAGGLQQPLAAPTIGANSRFADASGGRFSQGAGAPNGAYGRGGPLGGGGSAGGQPILPGVRIAADVTNNALLIYANQENYRIIERTLQQLDRPQMQVAIDATIAEVTLNDSLSYGVQFFLQSKNVGLPADTGSIVNTMSNTTAVLSRVLPGFNFLVGTEANPQMILNALHTVTDVKVLSTPSLVVLDNQFASLQVGDQIPITTGTATVLSTSNTVVNTVDYRNTGVILRVAPRINANGNVLLDIEQEISSVANNANANTLTPTVSQRKVRSSIAVASGQTVLLGGLMSETRNGSRTSIPGIEQLPGLGPLLSNITGSIARTELIIFIRPQIIRNGVDAHRIAQELRSKMNGKIGVNEGPGPKNSQVACCTK